MNKILIIFLIAISGVLGFIISWHQHSHTTPNLSSPTDVQVIETFHFPATFVKQLIGDPRAGEKIFKEYCTSCHGREPVIDIKAPRIDDTNAWKVRNKLGMSTLLRITIHGAGAMPARGGCFECSDHQLVEAIQYILNQSKNSHPSRQ